MSMAMRTIAHLKTILYLKNSCGGRFAMYSVPFAGIIST